MPGRKRAAAAAEVEGASTPTTKRRSARQSARRESLPAPSYKDTSSDGDALPKRSKKAAKKKSGDGAASNESAPAAKQKSASKKGPASKRASAKAAINGLDDKPPGTGSVSKTKAPANKAANGPATERAISEDPDVDSIPSTNPEVPRHDGEWHWLMKAEPESRLENGIDVKFSIDDLRAKDKPEPWDGIRAYPARNNLRSMNVGDKAFFYHSNCKEPGIVGVMEIVKEASEDRGARKPGTPYFDPTATKEKNRWSLVHVKFVSKFAVPIFLKELREMGQQGKPLQDMQVLKQTRLSVSRVSQAEWRYLCDVADQKAKEAGLEHEKDS